MKSEKLAAPLGLRLPERLQVRLEAVAAAQLSSPQALLRAAAAALVECHTLYGSVPTDMRIVQARHAAQAVEAQTPYTAENSRTPVDETAAEVADRFVELVKEHRLFRDDHLAPYFIPALRRALEEKLTLAAMRSTSPAADAARRSLQAEVVAREKKPAGTR